MRSTKRDPHGFLDGIKVARSKAMEEKAKKREKMIDDTEEEHHEIDWEKYGKLGLLEIDAMIF